MLYSNSLPYNFKKDLFVLCIRRFFLPAFIYIQHVCGSAFSPCPWGVETLLGGTRLHFTLCRCSVNADQDEAPAQERNGAGRSWCSLTCGYSDAAGKLRMGAWWAQGGGEKRNSSLAQGVSVWEHKGVLQETRSIALCDKGFPPQMTISLDERDSS